MRNPYVLILTIILGALSESQTASAFNVITDESAFQLIYENPTEIITFDSPAPNSFHGVTYQLSDGSLAQEIMDYGWSPSIEIGTLQSGGSCCWGATTWYGDYISPSIYDRPLNWLDRIYITFVGPVSVVSLKTSNGFYGFVPTDSTDNRFALPIDVTLTEVALGYSQVSSVPEPTSVALFCVGFGVIFLRRRSYKFSQLQTHKSFSAQ